MPLDQKERYVRALIMREIPNLHFGESLKEYPQIAVGYHIKEHIRGFYVFGGTVEADESDEMAIIREICEESTVQFQPGDLTLLPIIPPQYEHQGKQYHGTVWGIVLKKEDAHKHVPQTVVGESVLDVNWYDFHNLQEGLYGPLGIGMLPMMEIAANMYSAHLAGKPTQQMQPPTDPLYPYEW